MENDNKLTIRSNHKFDKAIIYGYELTEKEKQDYDFLEGEDLDYSLFFRYKKNLYFLGDFIRTGNGAWGNYPTMIGKYEIDGIMSNSWYSGIAVKFDSEMENLKVYTFYG